MFLSEWDIQETVGDDVGARRRDVGSAIARSYRVVLCPPRLSRSSRVRCLVRINDEIAENLVRLAGHDARESTCPKRLVVTPGGVSNQLRWLERCRTTEPQKCTADYGTSTK
jgi:hypothetical protein